MGKKRIFLAHVLTRRSFLSQIVFWQYQVKNHSLDDSNNVKCQKCLKMGIFAILGYQMHFYQASLSRIFFSYSKPTTLLQTIFRSVCRDMAPLKKS